MNECCRDALLEAAEAYPAITRDMVSRNAVKDWLRARASTQTPAATERLFADVCTIPDCYCDGRTHP